LIGGRTESGDKLTSMSRSSCQEMDVSMSTCCTGRRGMMPNVCIVVTPIMMLNIRSSAVTGGGRKGATWK